MAGSWMAVEFEVLEDNSSLASLAIKQAIRRALRSIGEQAVRYATDLVPVRTGNLKSSIAYDADDSKVFIGSSVPYASYVELGTSRMAARPYLRPALWNHAEEYRQIIEDELSNV